MRLAQDLRNAAWAIATTLIRLLPGRARGGTLVLRLDAIGDFLIWLSSGAAEVAAYARDGGPAVLLANHEWAPLASESGLFDDVWPIDPHRFQSDLGYRLSIQWAIRRGAFARVIQPRSARVYDLEEAIVAAAAAPLAIGNAGDPRNISPRRMKRADRRYRRLISAPTGDTTERERNLTFMRGLIGTPEATARIVHWPNRPPPCDLAARYFVVAPGAGWSGRRWPIERFAAVANRLCHLQGWQAVIVGSPGETELGAALQALIGPAARNLVGRANLVEVMAVARGAQLVLANESSMAHLGPLLGVPTVAILGGGHFGQFMPYAGDDPLTTLSAPVWAAMPCFNCNWRCRFTVAPQLPVPCIDAIGIDAVVARIDALLRRASPGEAMP